MISKMKGPAMPAGMLGMTGLPANSLSKGDRGERRGIQLKSIFEGHHGTSGIQRMKSPAGRGLAPLKRIFEERLANRVLAATEGINGVEFFVPEDRSRALDRRRSTLYAAHAHKDIELVRELSFARNGSHHRHVNEG